MGLRRYDAFVSYSSDPDGELAIALQDGLRKLYSPWYLPGPFLRVFRDATSMSPGGGLKNRIYRGLDHSDTLVVLLSGPAATKDGYVDLEVDHWRQRVCRTQAFAPEQTIIPVITSWKYSSTESGESANLAGFDWNGDDVPPSLHGVFPSDDPPLAVDMRWVHTSGEAALTLEHPDFRQNVAAIAASVKQMEPERFDAYLRARRTRATALIGTIGLAALILLGAIAVSVLAWRRAKGAELDAKQERDLAVLQTEAAEDQLTTLDGELLSKTAELERRTAEVDAKQAEVDAKQAEVDAKQAEVDAAEADLIEANAQVDAKQAEVDAAEADLIEANAQVDAKQAEVDAAEADLATASADLAGAARALTATEATRDAAIAAQSAAQRELTALTVELDGLQDQVQATELLVAAAEARLADTTEQLRATELLEEANDLANQAASATANGDAALGVLLALESLNTIDPPGPTSYRSLDKERTALGQSTWQQVGTTASVAPPSSARALSTSSAAALGTATCGLDAGDRRPSSFVRGSALTPDGRQLIVANASSIVAIDTQTSLQRVVARTATEICGFDVHPDGGTIIVAEASSTRTTLSAVDLSTGARTWTRTIVDIEAPTRLRVGDAGLIAVEGQRPGSETPATVLWDPASGMVTDLGIDARLASFDQQLILYTGGDTFPGALISFDQLFGYIFDDTFDLDRVEIVDIFDPGTGRMSVIAHPAGGGLLFADDRGSILRIDAPTAVPSDTRVTGGIDNPFIADKATSRAYVGAVDGVISILDLATLQTVAEYKVATTEIESLALDAQRQRLWIVDGSGGVTQVALDPAPAPLRQARAISFESDSPGTPIHLDATPDGSKLLIGSTRDYRPPSESVTVCGEEVDLLDWTVVQDATTDERWLALHPRLSRHDDSAASNRFMATTGHPASVAEHCYVQVRSLTDPDQPARYVEFPAGGAIRALAMTESDDTVVVATDGGFWLIDAADSVLTPRLLAIEARQVDDIEVSADGTLLAVEDADGLTIWTLAGETPVRFRSISAPQMDDIAISHDGTLLAGSHGSVVTVWDIETGAVVTDLDRRSGADPDLAFSRDGRFLATEGGSGLWTTATWDPVALTLPRTQLTDVTFLGTEATVAALGNSPLDGLPRVWINDSLSPAAACRAAVPFLEGRDADIASRLRAGRATSACR